MYKVSSNFIFPAPKFLCCFNFSYTLTAILKTK